MPNPNRYEPENRNKNKGTWFWDYGEEIDSSFNINYTDKFKFQVQSVSYPPIPVEQPKESKPFAPIEAIHTELERLFLDKGRLLLENLFHLMLMACAYPLDSLTTFTFLLITCPIQTAMNLKIATKTKAHGFGIMVKKLIHHLILIILTRSNSKFKV
ncbi:hypothetical protein RYX36_019220, partial [Vicia faba]